MALATPDTKTSSWGVPKASQPAVWIVDGQAVPASYGVIKTTTSGFLGSESTNHATIYDQASDAISQQVSAGMDAASASLKSFSKSLGQSEDDFRSTMKGVNSMMVAIPQGQEQLVYHNLANLQAEHYLDQTGLKSQADALLRSGESYIDLMTRTEAAATTAGAALGVVGLNLESMAGSAERLIQGDWASQVIDDMGGTQQFADAMTRFNKLAYSSAEQAEHSLTYYAGKANTAIAGLGVGGVDLTNFGQQYRQAMESGGMAPEQFKSWATAATLVEQAYNSTTTAAQLQTQALQNQVSAWNQTRQTLAATADQLSKTKDSLRAFLLSLRTDQYTTLSPTANLAERQQAYADVRAKAQGGDLQAQNDFRQYASDFREFAYDFYGANQDYVAIDQMIQSDTNGLISAADQQLTATNDQIAILDQQVALAQQQLATGSLTNDNLLRVAGAVESSGNSIVGAINSLGASATFDGGGQASAIDAANQAFLQQWTAMNGGGSSSPFDAAQGFASGGLVTGGIPGVDTVPAWLTNGERVLSTDHSRMLERIAVTSSATDTSTIEKLLAALLTDNSKGNAALEKRLAGLESKFAQVSSDLTRLVN